MPGRPLSVFPGIEVTTLEGVHLLAIFPLSYSAEQTTKFLGYLELSGAGDTAEASKTSVSDVLKKVNEEGGIVVVPHPFADKTGLLDSARKMSTRIEWLESGFIRLTQCPEDKIRYAGWDRNGRWLNRYVLASATPEQVDASNYCLAPLNVSDCYKPEEIGKGCSWFQMAELSIEGLKQVACEPVARISRTPPPVDTNDAILGLRVFGGYCDGQSVAFNPGLNCIVGPNHAGKSAILDFIRFAMGADDTAPPDVRSSLFQRLSAILGPGGKVELIVRSSGNLFVLKRTFLDLKEPAKSFRFDPQSQTLVPVEGFHMLMEVYEQGRIHRLRDDVNRQLDMLDEFAGLQQLRRKQEQLVHDLNASAREIAPLKTRLERLAVDLAGLPALESELAAKEALLPREEQERPWATAEAAASTMSTLAATLTGLLGRIDNPELSQDWDMTDPIWLLFNQQTPKIDDAVARPDLLVAWQESLNQALLAIAGARTSLLGALQIFAENSAEIEAKWVAAKTAHDAETSRELAKAGVDSPQELLNRVSELRASIHDLKNVRQPLLEQTKNDLNEKEVVRSTLLQDLESVDNQIREARSAKALDLSQSFGGQIEVALKPFGDRAEYKMLLNSLYSRISSREQQIKNIDAQLSLVADRLTPRELANALTNKGATKLKDGTESELATFCGVTIHTQNVLCAIAGDIQLLNRLQTARTPDLLQIRVKRQGEAVFADLATGLSPGEQSAALLTLTLRSRLVPLVLDQPEDELGYNYVVNLIAPKILQAKSSRQMLIVTHNANVPVLGDADYVIKMENKAKPEGGRQCIVAESGSFESAAITSTLLELEGGKRAFDFRRHRYSLSSQ